MRGCATSATSTARTWPSSTEPPTGISTGYLRSWPISSAFPVEILLLLANPIVARAAREASSTIPIVATGGNVVASGLVPNIAHPEGNVTGVTTNSLEAVVKWIELLKETVPTISRLGALVDLSGPSAQAFLAEVAASGAVVTGFSMTPYDVRHLDQLSGRAFVDQRGPRQMAWWSCRVE